MWYTGYGDTVSYIPFHTNYFLSKIQIIFHTNYQKYKLFFIQIFLIKLFYNFYK